jgi:acyl-CoA synthetase (AMP-forming)/AMP-acid ligase II
MSAGPMIAGSSDAHDGGPLVRRSAASTVASLFAARARVHPRRIAIESAADPEACRTYEQLGRRTSRLAAALAARAVGRGDRIALLSENRPEYLEVILAAGRIGAMVACQNWRLAPAELAHCLDLVEPTCVFVSARFADRLAALGRGANERPIVFGPDYERLVEAGSEHAAGTAFADIDPEDPLLILYTSGTTGLPKGAVLSHRAEIARNLVLRAEYGIAPDDTFAAWPPLYHMGSLECSLGTVMSGGTVITVDGFDPAELSRIVATRNVGYLLLMPGMVASFAAELRARAVRPRGVKICGVMADLVPPSEIAEITTLLGAPYGNTFGATETGWPPCSSNLIPVGVAPERLPKEQSPYCEVRLVDENDVDVEDGSPGELCVRGPTLFSGYFRAPSVNAHDFRGGWFHMGDVFVRAPDGSLEFVDRVKYLIKSGGESIYPAEIERVLLQDPRVAEAAVVRRADGKWGEVPVAFVAPRDPALTITELRERCRAQLAGYKQPKDIFFVSLEAFPRSASGKIQRSELEKRLPSEGAPDPHLPPPMPSPSRKVHR